MYLEHLVLAVATRDLAARKRAGKVFLRPSSTLATGCTVVTSKFRKTHRDFTVYDVGKDFLGVSTMAHLILGFLLSFLMLQQAKVQTSEEASQIAQSPNAECPATRSASLLAYVYRCSVADPEGYLRPEELYELIQNRRNCPITLPDPALRIWNNDRTLEVTAPAAAMVVAGQERNFLWRRYVAGYLAVEGHRLDGLAPPLRVHIPDGYGMIGYQASSIAFPTPGCWEVTGRAGDESLSFVVLVVKEGWDG